MAIIGIDLGTSNPAATVLRGGRPVIIPSAAAVSLGGKAFPGYVAVAADGQMLSGEPARRQAAANPEGIATAFERRMGSARPSSCATNPSPPSSCLPFCCRRSSAVIPRGIQPDTVLRLPSPVRWKGKGDLYLQIRIRIPEKIDREERELYERLRAGTSTGIRFSARHSQESALAGSFTT